MNFSLQRDSDDGVQTFGRWLLADGSEFAKTLERPWLDDRPDVSCIPTGTWVFEWLLSPHHSAEAGHPVYKWTAQNVPGRSGVQIDVANWVRQLLGCVAIGDAISDDVDDQGPGITNSADAYRRLETLLGTLKRFTLTILPIPPSIA